MRYTTLIDITELRRVYASPSARLLYLHLALIAGYRESDMNICNVSIRRLAQDTGLTVSAVRHALLTLERNELIRRSGGVITVKKVIDDIQVKSYDKQSKRRSSKKANSKAEDYEGSF